MTTINKSELDFLLDAKKMFEAYPDLATWRSAGNLDEIIALRTGIDRENIEVFRIEKVAEFKKVLSPAPALVLDTE